MAGSLAANRVENVLGVTNRKQLVKGWRETDPQETINEAIKEQEDFDYKDALNHLPVSSCIVL